MSKITAVAQGDLILAAPRRTSIARRFIDPRLRRCRWRGRLRTQFVEDRSQGPNAIAERVLGSTDELDQLDGQDGFFFVR